jgi:hypothetical protein
MSLIEVITAADTFRLTTLQAVQAEIHMSSELIFVESLIDQASDAVAADLDTILAQQRYRETELLCFEGPWLFLRYAPIVAVDSVLCDGDAVTDYRIGAPGARLYRASGWGYGPWSSATPWYAWPHEWTVTYVAGYILPQQMVPPDASGPLLPERYERATIEAVKVWHNDQYVDQRIQSRTLGDQRIEYSVQTAQRALPHLSQDLLRSSRRWALA